MGSEIASPDLPVSTYEAINRAVVKAVRKLGEDTRPYLHHLIGEVPPEIERLSVEDFRLDRLRFVEPRPYPQEEFQRTYDWMVSWGLVQEDSGYGKVVENLVRI